VGANSIASMARMESMRRCPHARIERAPPLHTRAYPMVCTQDTRPAPDATTHAQHVAATKYIDEVRASTYAHTVSHVHTPLHTHANTCPHAHTHTHTPE
jgi:hypothetical protein